MHISILDSSGMAVAITSTVNLVFGSQVLDPETGIIFNDEVTETTCLNAQRLTFRRWTISVFPERRMDLAFGLRLVRLLSVTSPPPLPFESR